MNRIEQSPAVTARTIGRYAERNLSSLASATIGELRRVEAAALDGSPLLAIGVAILRARQGVRAGIRDAERAAWSARR